MSLRRLAVVLFDLDGTLWVEGVPLPGTVAALGRLAAAGCRIGVVTNNSYSAADQVQTELTAAGYHVDRVFAAIDGAAAAVADMVPGGRVLVVGSRALSAALRGRGLQVCRAGPADVVVVGNDTALTHAGLSQALEALLGGARFVALNMDRSYRGPGGSHLVGGGALVHALQYAAGRAPDLVVGKPSPRLLQDALRYFDVTPEQVLFVGDSPDTDVAAAVAARVRSALVATGVRAIDPHGPTADLMVDTVPALLAHLDL